MSKPEPRDFTAPFWPDENFASRPVYDIGTFYGTVREWDVYVVGTFAS